MNWMLKNSKGKPDGSWTLCVVAFFVSSLSIFLSLLENIQFKEFQLHLKQPDTTLVLGYLATFTGNYLMRRNKTDQHDHEQTMKGAQ